MAARTLYGTWGGPAQWIDAAKIATLEFIGDKNSVDVLMCHENVSIITYGLPQISATNCRIHRFYWAVSVKKYIGRDGDQNDAKLADNIIKRYNEFAGLPYLMCGLRLNPTTRNFDGITLIHPDMFHTCELLIDGAMSLVRPVQVLHWHNGVWSSEKMSATDLRDLGFNGRVEIVTGYDETTRRSTLMLFNAQIQSSINTWCRLPTKPSHRSRRNAATMISTIFQRNPQHIYIVGIIGNMVAPQPHIFHMLQLGDLIPAETVIMHLQEPADDNGLAYDDD